MSTFVESKRGDWAELERLLDKAASSGLDSLSTDELDRLATLYRRATSHLARSLTRGEDPRVTQYLNDLVARAHGCIYRAPPVRRQTIIPFLVHVFPQTFRRTVAFTATAFAIFVGAALLSYAAVRLNEDTAEALMPLPLLSRSQDDVRQGRLEWWGELGMAPAMSGTIMTNNIYVAFVAFAGGMTACALTVYALVVNGAMLGALSGFFGNHGLGLQLWGLIAPHGLLELSAIFICGGAGLRLGYSMIDPGDHARRDAIVIAAGEAIRLVVGTIPLFVVAAVIEGFVTPMAAPPLERMTFAVIVEAALVVYLLQGWRSQPGKLAARG